MTIALLILYTQPNRDVLLGKPTLQLSQSVGDGFVTVGMHLRNAGGKSLPAPNSCLC